MGFFDLLTPFFIWIDEWFLVSLPLSIKLLLWALFSAFVGVFVFAKLYDSKKLGLIKDQLKISQKALIECEGEFSELKSLIWENIKLSLKRMKITMLPALVSVIPVVFILTFLSNQYDLQKPQVGDIVPYQLNFENESNSASWYWLNENNGDQNQILTWPANDDTLILTDGNETILEAPFYPVSVVHKSKWWNVLIANPAGGLMNPSSEVKEVRFEFEQQPLPAWIDQYLGGWLWYFMILAVVFSVGFMLLFKIRF